MPVLSSTAEPADLSQPAAAVASCATFGEQDGGEQSHAWHQLIDGICYARDAAGAAGDIPPNPFDVLDLEPSATMVRDG